MGGKIAKPQVKRTIFHHASFRMQDILGNTDFTSLFYVYIYIQIYFQILNIATFRVSFCGHWGSQVYAGFMCLIIGECSLRVDVERF